MQCCQIYSCSMNKQSYCGREYAYLHSPTYVTKNDKIVIGKNAHFKIFLATSLVHFHHTYVQCQQKLGYRLCPTKLRRFFFVSAGLCRKRYIYFSHFQWFSKQVGTLKMFKYCLQGVRSRKRFFSSVFVKTNYLPR